jgi:hypothetical protein
MNFDRVSMDVIPDLLIFLSPCVSAEPLELTPFQHAGATCDIQNVYWGLAIRGVYANSVPAHSRFLNGQLREVTGDW